MEPFFIALICAISIFVVTSITVLICRRKKQNRFQGQVFSPPQATDTAIVPDGYTVSQLPPSYGTTGQQTQMYAVSYPTQGAPQQMSMPLPQGHAPAPGLASNVTLYQQNPTSENMIPPSYASGNADSIQTNTKT